MVLKNFSRTDETNDANTKTIIRDLQKEFEGNALGVFLFGFFAIVFAIFRIVDESMYVTYDNLGNVVNDVFPLIITLWVFVMILYIWATWDTYKQLQKGFKYRVKTIDLVKYEPEP